MVHLQSALTVEGMYRLFKLSVATALISVLSVFGPIHQVKAAGSCVSGVTPAGTALTVSGYEGRRTFVQLARNADGTVKAAAPLLVMMHGMKGCVEAFQSVTKIDTMFNAYGVHVLWVTAGTVNTSTTSTWDLVSGRDDTYVARAVDTMSFWNGLRPKAVVPVGISNGAGMAVHAVCKNPARYAGAVSAASWAVTSVTCGPVKRSLFVVSGTLDRYNGLDTTTELSSRWRSKVTTCSNKPTGLWTSSQLTATWAGCTSGSIVRETHLSGYGHIWPNVPGFDGDANIVIFAKSLSTTA
jgi:poly(3-hydroxybutyrate) depolymerase